MNQDLFTFLPPPEIIINILSRLPIGTALSCNCVCKSWLELIETAYFAKSHFANHFSQSPPIFGVVQYEASSKTYKIVEFDLHRSKTVFNFTFPHGELTHISVQGLLFLFNYMKKPHGYDDLFICNPITRDYVTLPPLKESSSSKFQLDSFGFGVSNLTGQFKVVTMFHESSDNPLRTSSLVESKCEVYTLGTRSWRSVAVGGPIFLYPWMTSGSFLNGNLYWKVIDSEKTEWISCFDLETEEFSTFSTPPSDDFSVFKSLFALGDCLYLCNDYFDEIYIWLLNMNGDEKSWRKEFVISKHNINDRGLRLKRFKNNTLQDIDIDLTGLFAKIDPRAVMYTPSFLPLKTFEIENVSSF